MLSIGIGQPSLFWHLVTWAHWIFKFDAWLPRRHEPHALAVSSVVVSRSSLVSPLHILELSLEPITVRIVSMQSLPPTHARKVYSSQLVGNGSLMMLAFSIFLRTKPLLGSVAGV